MVYLRRGEGGPPSSSPSPPTASWDLLLIGPFPPTGPFCFSIKNPRFISHFNSWMIQKTQQVMAQPQPCLVCKKPVTKPSILMCCEQPCHLTCAKQQQREQNIPCCFRCGRTTTLHVLEILHEEWKKDPQFMKEVKRYWYQHTFPGIIHHLLPLWYGIAYQFKCGEPIYLEDVQGFWGRHPIKYCSTQQIEFLGHTPSEVISSMKELNPFPTTSCIVCKKDVTYQNQLICCRTPCHVACADHWRKNPHLIPNCIYIRQSHSTTVIEILHYDWKQDPQFVKKVERIWNGNLWYGICHTDTGAAEGFWGKIFKNPDTISNIPYFLGHTLSEVLPNMKNILSCQ